MTNDSNGIENKNSNNSSQLPAAFIQKLVDNYRNNQLALINQNMAMDDAHSIWFDLVTLKNFIAEIETEALAIDPAVENKDLGIRFYYAAYSPEMQPPIPSNYSKKHTLVMVPTKKEEGLNYDFNPFQEEEGKALAVTGIALAQNHGDLVPPGASIVESY
ncbi:hypothetical protein NAL32_00980 [Chryseobacterium sp. Ch-15]|uniref:Uncharacterized protein n=1 Tax=Chryseobacterium muglaense TaxID=2893752 RepID=A0A9Q3USD2_9FLAO|nr:MULTISPECIES: hypothetical protein [Chryseobacterium]MBD3903622.1 hypothetical protein [Chryseobacterium muglaense]MBO6183927.1 hypothetical protein [Chryseobacterium sp.]MCC9034693.1 hypothetical protein [Chryseobacterium muglaense]MCM2552956.1 hypothetical protein [Chryseobacterium muglaense]